MHDAVQINMTSIEQTRERAAMLRREVHRFARDVVPGDLRERSGRHEALEKPDYEEWMRLLYRQGWATAHWPAQYGGQDWSLLERFVLEDELARHGLPWIIPFGVKYVGPVLYRFGSEAQKARFLPPIAETAEWWAQGYSEPGAGSDLAALSTTADREGNDYIVNGQKVWTTYAQWADWIFCLVRTQASDRPQKGISFLLIDMRSPGVTVRPIVTMDGHHHVNEVWFENVRVPVSNRVGEEGDGWKLAKFLLQNERTTGGYVGIAWYLLRQLEGLLATRGDEPGLAQRAKELRLRCFTLSTVCYRLVENMMSGVESGAEASLMKIRATELHQDLAQACVDALGYLGRVDTGGHCESAEAEAALGPAPLQLATGLSAHQLYLRATTIYGGSTEIQRNIVAKLVLGL